MLSTYRCLAHIINLATQALISTRSQAKYYSAHAEDVHIPDLSATDRDEVGLVRSIAVKVWYQYFYCIATNASSGTFILPT